MNVYIKATYTSQFGELWELSLLDLFKQGVEKIFSDSEVKKSEIEAVFVSNMGAGSFNKQRHLNAYVSSLFSHHPPAMRVEGACASGGLAILAAQQALLAGVYHNVLVIGAEKMTDVTVNDCTDYLATASNYYQEYGASFPALYALLASNHMKKFGTNRDQLSAVAVKNHKHALTNSKAQFKREFSIEQVNKSSMVASPLRLLDCSPISDGVSAIVLSTKGNSSMNKLVGYGHGQDCLELANRESLDEIKATKRAGKQAYHQARITEREIKVAEVHDCFTIAEILAIEDLGFFKKGTGGQATISGETTYGGKLVVNPSGGLKACGHPIGVTGVKQLVSLDSYLKANQVEYGLALNVGGSGATAVVNILKK